MESHRIVSHEQWIAARMALLAKEKEFTRARDQLSQERRELPWVRVDKPYVFDGPDGKVTLGDLFAGRSQLIVYHFMFAPDWGDGCQSCSFSADNLERSIVHLTARDVPLVAVSCAALSKLEAFRRRRGWTFTWVAAAGIDFNFHYHLSFTPQDLARESSYNYRPTKRSMQELP